MPTVLNSNRDGVVIVRNNGANEWFSVSSNLVSNSSVNTFVSAADAAINLHVDGVSIRKAMWSTDSGVITVGRIVNSSTNVAILKLSYAGVMDLDGMGCASNSALDFPQCNLYVNSTSSNSTLILKLKKMTTPSGETA